jgi:uncharacterized protein YndB with AHSA1/START domain
MSEQKSEIPYRDLSITRVFDAPVEEVWKAWTVPERFKAWWGGGPYTTSKVEIDLREGGRFLWCMQAPAEEGSGTFCNAGTFQKIVPNQLLQFTTSASDEQGNPISAPEWGGPAQFDTEVRFESLGGKTVLTYVERNWPVGEMFAYAYTGMVESLDKLEEALKGASVTARRS